MTRVAGLRNVSVVRDEKVLLSLDRLEIESGSRWVLLGPNGSGKSTLLSILSGRLWPTTGEVELLGHRLGRVDLRTLRTSLGFFSSSLARQLRPALSVHDVVLTGVDGALEPWWREYDDADHVRADHLLAELGVGQLSKKSLGIISDGERTHVLLARVLMSNPELLCLDEPAAGLDVGARERLLERLGAVMAAPKPEGAVLVTHHVEEIPPFMTHGALLREGALVASGPLEEVMTSKGISTTFGIEISLQRDRDGRYSARGKT